MNHFTGYLKQKQNAEFRNLYNLLQLLFPEMIGNEKPNYSIQYESKHCHYDNAFARRQEEDNKLIEVGTAYYVDGDWYFDPSFVVFFDNELQLARVTEWGVDSPDRQWFPTKFYQNFDCKNFHALKTDAESVANECLNIWLATFIIEREDNPDGFMKIPDED